MVALVYGAEAGKDSVNLAARAPIALQISRDGTSYSVEFGPDSMTVKMREGNVAFKGIGTGTVGIKQGDGGMTLIAAPSPQKALNIAI